MLGDFKSRIQSFIQAAKEWSYQDDWRTWLTHTAVWFARMFGGGVIGAGAGLAAFVLGAPNLGIVIGTAIGLVLGWEHGVNFYLARERSQFSRYWEQGDVAGMVDSFNDFVIPLLVNTAILVIILGSWFYNAS